MPALNNPRQERYAQLVANGEQMTKAYAKAGYQPDGPSAAKMARKPHIAARISQLIDDRRSMELKSQEKAVRKVSVTREWVLERLIYNAERCLRGQPLLDANGVQVPGKYTGKPEAAAANRALELVGKELGMFIDRHEFGRPGAFAELSDAELATKIETMGSQLGIAPKALQAVLGQTKH